MDSHGDMNLLSSHYIVGKHMVMIYMGKLDRTYHSNTDQLNTKMQGIQNKRVSGKWQSICLKSRQNNM